MKRYAQALVIGGGAFGTSIASVLSHNFREVLIKVRSQDVFESLLKKENTIYLEGHRLDDSIRPILNWNELDIKKQDIEIIVIGLPTSALQVFLQENLELLKSFLKRNIPMVVLSKGIDPETLFMPDDIFFSSFPEFKESICFLSGPSFAKEILDKQLTLVNLAGQSRSTLLLLSPMLETRFFKVYPTYDIKGVLLGGALKNILAIAGGIIEGLGYNHNTRAAMITRGIQEMLRFGIVFNARPETFYGLSGMGDLILTTTGDTSRNKLFGLQIAKGLKPEKIISSSRNVVEGYQTTRAAYLIAQKYQIRTTIFEALYRVLYQDISPEQIIQEIMQISGKFTHE